MHTVISFFLHGSPLLVYLIVAVVLMLESSGVPIANTTLLLLAGAMASFGHINICFLAISAILGSVTGAFFAYTLGVHGGRRILLRVATFFHIDRRKVHVVEHWFGTSGVWMIFFSRMLPYVRPFACFPAGISRMLLPHFFISAFSGSTIWCVAILSVGWYLGRRWGQALHLIQSYTFPVLGAIALLIGIYVCISRAIKHYLSTRLQADANKACDEADENHHNLLKA